MKSSTTLYKRLRKAGVFVWTIEVDGRRWRTVYHRINDTPEHTEWKEAAPYNVGKISEIPAHISALLIAEREIRHKREQGFLPHLPPAYATDVDGVGFALTKFTDWRHIPYPFSYPVVSHGAIGGIRASISFRGVRSRRNRLVPVGSKWAEETFMGFFNRHPNIALDGEFFNPDDMMPLYIKQKPTQEALEAFAGTASYWAFDAFFSDDQFLSFIERRERVDALLLKEGFGAAVSLAPYVEIRAREELDTEFNKYITSGMRSQIIRNKNSKYVTGVTQSVIERRNYITESYPLLSWKQCKIERPSIAYVLDHPAGNLHCNGLGWSGYHKEALASNPSMAIVTYSYLRADGLPGDAVVVGLDNKKFSKYH